MQSKARQVKSLEKRIAENIAVHADQEQTANMKSGHVLYSLEIGKSNSKYCAQNLNCTVRSWQCVSTYLHAHFWKMKNNKNNILHTAPDLYWHVITLIPWRPPRLTEMFIGSVITTVSDYSTITSLDWLNNECVCCAVFITWANVPCYTNIN